MTGPLHVAPGELHAYARVTDDRRQQQMTVTSLPPSPPHTHTDYV